MSGIFGIITPQPEEINLERVNFLLRHRGPDSSGNYHGEGIALSATLLCINDNQQSQQPLENEDGTIIMVCDGEIVNALELRRQLENSGHHFKSNSNIETVLHGYEAWGGDVVNHLRGLFAFAVWDSNAKKLMLARDRFGLKPLCYLRHGGRFVFCSEINPMLDVLPRFPRETNLEALWRLFEAGFIPTPLTAFKDIYRLSAGHYMTVEDGVEQTHCYWKPVFPRMDEHSRISLTEAADGFIEKILEALHLWQNNDQPVGSLLSGGIDSTSVSALLAEISPQPIHTFNLGFQAQSLDESNLARDTAKYIGSKHHEMIFRLESLDTLPAVIKHLEQPHHSASTSLYRIFEGCNEAGFKAVMSGEGADELLGGYPWYRTDQQLRPYMRLFSTFRHLLGRMPIIHDKDKRFVLRYAGASIPSRYLGYQRGLRAVEISNLLLSPTFYTFDEYLIDQYVNDLEGRHPFDQMLFIESQTRLVDFINYGLDRVSMAHSVEARPVFQDHLLWEFTAQLPPEYKLTDQENKYLLRHGMRERLPKEIIQRPKKGLTSPQSSWFRKPRLPDWAEDCLSTSSIQEYGLLQSSEVRRLLAEHRSGKANHGNTLVKILTTQIWQRIFIKQQVFSNIDPETE